MHTRTLVTYTHIEYYRPDATVLAGRELRGHKTAQLLSVVASGRDELLLFLFVGRTPAAGGR